jgi:hypothetical protein
MNYRQLLAALLSTLLAALPSLAMPQTAAVAGPSKSTSVGNGEVTQGTNIMNGDTVEVAQNGDTVLLMGHNATVRVPSNSAVRIFKCGDRSVVQLLRGQLTFRATPQRPIRVQFGDAMVEPAAGQQVIGLVALTSPTTASMTAQQGSFTVSTAHEGKSAVVNQGETQQATLASAADVANPNPPICGVAAAVPSHAVSTAWVMIGLGAAGLATGLALSGHQTSLTCPEKGALVSPYSFPCP